MLLLLSGIGAFGLYQLDKTQDRLEFLGSDTIIAITAAEGMKEANYAARLALLHAAVAPTDAARNEEYAKVEKNLAKLEENLAAYRETDTSGREKFLSDIETHYGAFKKAAPNVLQVAVDEGAIVAEKYIKAQTRQSGNAMSAAIDGLLHLEMDVSKDEIKASGADYSQARAITIAVIVMAIAVGIAIAIGVARLLSVPLRKAVDTLQLVAEGRLDVRLDVESRDEVGQMAKALNAALDSLREALRDIGGNVKAVAAASEELTATAHDIASGAGQAAAQIEAMSESASEVSASVSTVADGTDEMSSAINEIASGAATASSTVGEAVGMANTTRDTMSKLGASSEEVGNVVKVIASIAAQTNLLALNATIEAARAGESGRGFAVVASEVKELAEETAKATKEISQRVQTIQADTTDAVSAIEGISAIISNISDSQTTIASAVEEQTATTRDMSRSVLGAATGANRIAGEVTSIAAIANESKHGADASASAAKELAVLASSAQSALDRFVY